MLYGRARNEGYFQRKQTQLSTGTVDTDRKLIVECKRKPAFVLVPIEEYLRESK
jgi:hypothetical protein